MPSSTSIEVASVTALKRLDGVEFTIKSQSMERLFRTLSGGNVAAVSRTAARAPTPGRRRPGEDNPFSNQDSDDVPSPRRESEASASVAYAGATRRYALELVENGIPRQLAGFNHGRFDLWGCPELVHSRGPRLNLSILTAVGIDGENGAQVTIPTVVSDKLLTEYLEGLKAAMRQLYIDYIGDRTHTIIITCEHSISS